MCFDPVTLTVMAVGAITSIASSALAKKGANDAAVHNYNEQARMAEQVNRNAIAQQREADSRAQLEASRNKADAVSRTQEIIQKNRIAQGTARASAGTSGLMGLPMNLIDQQYQSLIGTAATNLDTYSQRTDQNTFFTMMDNALRANSISNQAVPAQPYMQQFGAGDVLMGIGQGVASGIGSFKGFGKPGPSNATLSSSPQLNNQGFFNPQFNINGAL